MGVITTTYDVQTRYLLKDQVSGSAAHMTGALRASANEARGLDSTLKSLAVAAAGLFGIREMKKHLIDFNSEMEQAKLTTAGFMAMSGLGTFNDNLGEADALVKQYTLDARASIGTTADFVDMSKMMTAAVTRSGGSMKDLHDITKGMVISSKALGFAPQIAAIEATEALMGNVTIRNRYAQYLLGSIGYGDETGRSRYQQLSTEKRLSELKRSLGGAWLKDLASAQEHSMLGATSTFMDNAQLAAMRAGKALFDAIKVDLNQWNEYLIKNGDKIDHIAEVVGHDLVTGFKAIKDVTVFIYDHWKALALIYAGFKIPGMVAGFTGGLAGGLGGVGGAAMAGGTIGPWGAAIVSAGTMLAAVIIDAIKQGKMQASYDEKMAANYGVGVKGGTIDAFISASEKFQTAKTAQERDEATRLVRAFGHNQDIANAGQLESAAGNWTAEQRTRMAKIMGKKGGEDSWAAMRLSYGWTSVEDLRAAIDGSRLVQILGTIPYNMMDDKFGWNMMDHLNPEGTGKKPPVKVTINRIEVVSDDPDRFAFGLDELVQTAASRRGITPGYLPPAWQKG